MRASPLSQSLLGRLLNSGSNAHLRHEGAALVEFTAYLATYRGSGALIGVTWFLNLHSEPLGPLNRPEEALAVLGELEALASQTEERLSLADALRLKGEVLIARGNASGPDEAVPWFKQAILRARSQGAWLPAMRAALPLARLLHQQADQEGARTLDPDQDKRISWIRCPIRKQVGRTMAELGMERRVLASDVVSPSPLPPRQTTHRRQCGLWSVAPAKGASRRRQGAPASALGLAGRGASRAASVQPARKTRDSVLHPSRFGCSIDKSTLD